MNCSEIETLTVEYLTGQLEPASRARLEAHVEQCPACREALRTADEMWQRLGALPQAQPSPQLRERVDLIIEAYRQGMNQPTAGSAARFRLGEWLAALWPRQVAFSALVAAAAFVAGVLAPPLWSRDSLQPQALDSLRDEVGHLRQMVTLTLLRQPSATERLEGVSYSYLVAPQDDKVLSALLQALDSDPNVNVRVAAVDALRQFAAQASVRTSLLRSLAKESSPLVQVGLIDLLVQQREKACIPVLEQIRQNTGADPAVRDQADKALRQLI